MRNENTDIVLADYNANEAISRRIDMLTGDTINALSMLRSDGTKAWAALDLLKNIWDEIYPTASEKGNANLCAKDVAEVQVLFTECYDLANREVRRASGFGVSRGASSKFMAKIHRLKTLVQLCAQRFGFGMTGRHYGNYSSANAGRALE